MDPKENDELLAVVFDYIETYGLSDLARKYFMKPGNLDGTTVSTPVAEANLKTQQSHS